MRWFPRISGSLKFFVIYFSFMLTLILPHFLRAPDERLPELHTPALNQLLRAARFQAVSETTAALYQTHLCDQLALPKHAVYASPLNQQIGLNTVSAQHGASLAITAEEAQTWCDGLNQLYGTDAQFTVLRPDLWRIDLPQAVDWQIDNIFNLNHILNPHDAPSDWLQLFTETQMWLHQHPLNQNRKPCNINGLWIWNAPDNMLFQASAAIASDSAWASHSSANVQPMPEHFTAWQQYCASQQLDINHSKMFSETFIQAAEPWDYADELTRWDNTFFAPLHDALLSGSLKTAKIITEQGELIIHKPSPLHFWKRAKTFNGSQLM